MSAPVHHHENDLLLRPSLAAKRLGVCTETVWRWMRKGVIAFEEVGPYRKKRIRSSIVSAMIRRGSDDGVA